MDNQTVSVVIPAYKCAEYIRQALDSVFAQTAPPLEVIVVDDCSPDGLKSLLRDDISAGRIIYLCNPQNAGVAESRNRGVAAARGKYIAFLDADDWWAPNKLEKQVALLDRENAVLCCTARAMTADNGQPTGQIIHVPTQISYKQLRRHNAIACSSVLLRRDVALAIPMEHDRYHEDYIAWLRITEAYGPALGIDEPLLFYRLSPGGKSRNRLKSAKMTYGVHRCTGQSPTAALYYTACHLVGAARKYAGRGK